MCTLLSIVVRLHLLDDEDRGTNSTLDIISKVFSVCCLIMDMYIIHLINDTYPIR